MFDTTIGLLPRWLFHRLTRDVFCHWSRKHWRARFAGRLAGRGLEIGALVAPMPVRPGVTVRNVDRLPEEALQAEYPKVASKQPLRAVDIVDDAATLETIPDASEDFLIAAHVFEHMSNPARALEAWCRVVKPGGFVYLVIPHPARTFDWRRARTTLDHLALDYHRPSIDRDFEHFVDYATHVHRARNPKDAIEEADRLLASGFSIHYHVFAPADLARLLAWFDQHVRRVTIVAGPHAPWLSDEVHVLLQTMA
jgi:SAM-dependent methyltransferase